VFSLMEIHTDMKWIFLYFKRKKGNKFVLFLEVSSDGYCLLFVGIMTVVIVTSVQHTDH